MDIFRKMEIENVQKRTNEAINIIKNVYNDYISSQEKIISLEKEIQENKDEKLKKLEEENKKLKKQISEFESTTELYGFNPKERTLITKWFKEHYEKEKEENFMKKNPSHYVCYMINIFPEVAVKTAKCKCGAYLDIYDSICDAWAYDKNGNKEKFKP